MSPWSEAAIAAAVKRMSAAAQEIVESYAEAILKKLYAAERAKQRSLIDDYAVRYGGYDGPPHPVTA